MPSGRRRILHFIESGGVYGAERVILNLSREMQLTPDLHPVVGCIVNSTQEQSDLYDAALVQGIDAIKIPIPNARLPVALPQAARLLREQNIDLIHSHGYKPSVFGFAIRLMTGIPIITTCHLWFEPNKAPFKTRVMVALEKIFYRGFPCVIAVSEPIKQILIDHGIKPNKIQVIKNGVDIPELNLSDSEKSALRAELGLSASTFCVLNAGRLARQKSQRTLIEAAAILKRDINASKEDSVTPTDIRMVIIGEGPLEQELRRLVVQHELENWVSLLGFRSDIDRLLAITDVFALPSLDEGMPMALLEAAAAQVAIITTAVGDIPKLITHDVTGLIVPKEDPQALADAIKTLAANKEKRKQLAIAACLSMQKQNSSHAMGQQYHAVYQNLLARP